MSLVNINWQPDKKELRKFGITVLIGFAIIGLVFFFTGKTPTPAYWLWGIGALFGLAGVTGTVVALPFYYAWMAVAFVMGNIMSRVIMFIIFFGVVTPLGIIMRLTGRDRLLLKKSADAKSYWLDVSPIDKDSYQRQF